MRTCRTFFAVIAAFVMIAPAAADQSTDRADELRRRRSPVVEVFERSRDAVVNIASTEIVTVRSRSPFDSFFDEFFDMPTRPRERQYTRSSVGSGFVIHPDGYIVTNAHVVARTTERKAIFADGREYDAQIVASDPQRDLAVLRIETDEPLPTLPLGRSDDLMIGETVIAIGNALGYEHTVTAGVVSSLGRDISASGELTFEDLIQTDASINPGNSGGPLLNVLGELIGVNSAIRADAENIGFAIPVDQLRDVLPDLLDVERRYRIETGMKVDHFARPRVVEVIADSPAHEAGVEPGDVLVAIDGEPVREGIDFDIALINRKPGEKLPLRLERGGEPVRATLTLGERPAPDADALARDKLGLEVEALPDRIIEQLGLSRAGALVVKEVEYGGPADAAGLEPGDVLLSLGRHYVASREDLGQLLEANESGSVLPIRVLRIERRGPHRVKVQRSGPIEVR
jgi:serine protease Do